MCSKRQEHDNAAYDIVNTKIVNTQSRKNNSARIQRHDHCEYCPDIQEQCIFGNALIVRYWLHNDGLCLSTLIKATVLCIAQHPVQHEIPSSGCELIYTTELLIGNHGLDYTKQYCIHGFTRLQPGDELLPFFLIRDEPFQIFYCRHNE